MMCMWKIALICFSLLVIDAKEFRSTNVYKARVEVLVFIFQWCSGLTILKLLEYLFRAVVGDV